MGWKQAAKPPTSPSEAPQRARILTVDDDRLARWSLRQRLEQEGHEVVEAGDGANAWPLFEQGVDVVLLDHRLPDTDGLTLLRRMMAVDAQVPVIMLTAYASIEQAVSAMRIGALHYARKPCDLDALVVMIERALRTSRLWRRLHAHDHSRVDDALVGGSAVMRRTKDLLARVARSRSSTVLLTGESGTGKDLAARIVHELSGRGEGPFVNVTCSALNAPLLESELFGHERGAFTDAKERKRGLLELAHQGTLFLDEIGEMSTEMQAKLLRVVEEKVFRRVGGSTDIRVDARLVAATNRDLRQAVREGAFREDLYYRLAVLTVEMPPLRSREGDLEILLQHFVERFNREFHRSVEGVSPAARAALSIYTWPGNIRELRNAVERAVLLSERSTLEKSDFTMVDRPANPESLDEFRLPSRGVDFAELERSLVVQALERARGNRTLAASLLGMNRDQIRYRVDKFGLPRRSGTDFQPSSGTQQPRP